MPTYKTKAQLEVELANLELELLKTREAANKQSKDTIEACKAEMDGLKEANAGLLGRTGELGAELSGVWGYFSPELQNGAKVTRVLTVVFDYESEDKSKHRIYVWATPGPEVGFKGWPPYGMNVIRNAVSKFWRTRNKEVRKYAARNR